MEGIRAYMKHFFYSYDESFKLDDLLEKYMSQESDLADAEALKVYYDIVDIISDKRFEQRDNLLKTLEKIKKNTTVSEEEKPDSEKEEHYRLLGLKAMWDKIEQQYKLYTTNNKGMLYDKAVDNGHTDEQYELSIMLVLYHLVRGNLCLRISQCYYENYKLDDSDSWAGKGIEIFWHGKNLIATLRDSSQSDKRVQADLYLRPIKLNLAKYYRDYARKNRRSDFDAALDEFKQVRYRMEKEYEHISNPEQKRQYIRLGTLGRMTVFPCGTDIQKKSQDAI